MKITETYQRRLVNYLRWASMESVGTAGSVRGLCGGQSEDGLTPEEVMFRWETRGEKELMCQNSERLYRYAAGKSVRDFYVSNWVKDVRDGLFVAEEFICTGGMDTEEFHNVFKRYPDPWLLKRIWTESVSSKAAEAPGGQVCACAEVGRVYPFNGKHFCSNCKRQVITPNWRGFSDRVARLIWPDNSEAFPGMSSPEQVAANKALNERQWKSISDLIFNEIFAMAAPAAPSGRGDADYGRFDFSGMKNHEVESFKNITSNLNGAHFTDSCVEFLKKCLDALRIPHQEEK